MGQLVFFIPCAGAYAPAYPDYVPIISRNNCVYVTIDIFYSVCRSICSCISRLCAYHQ